MPKGSIVIGAGNHAEDSAFVKPMPSALINRMFHINLRASHPWHILSDALKSYGEDISDELIGILAYGSISPIHAGQFKAFVKQIRNKYALNDIIKGDPRWPDKPEDRDILYFLAQSLRDLTS